MRLPQECRNQYLSRGTRVPRILPQTNLFTAEGKPCLLILIGSNSPVSSDFTGGDDMQYFKARIFALGLILVSIGLIYFNWHQLLQEGRYSMKLAAFSPVVGIGGIYLLIFPSRGGKPTTAREKIIVLIVYGIGLVAG